MCPHANWLFAGRTVKWQGKPTWRRQVLGYSDDRQWREAWRGHGIQRHRAGIIETVRNQQENRTRKVTVKIETTHNPMTVEMMGREWDWPGKACRVDREEPVKAPNAANRFDHHSVISKHDLCPPLRAKEKQCSASWVNPSENIPSSNFLPLPVSPLFFDLR